MKNHATLLTLDRLRLAVSRNRTVRQRADVADNVDLAYNAVIRRDVLSTR